MAQRAQKSRRLAGPVCARLLFFLVFSCAGGWPALYAEDASGQGGGFLDAGYRRVGYNYNAPPPPDGAASARTAGPERFQNGGTADEIRALVEHGAPDALKQALTLITQRNLASSEFGRLMGSIALTLLEKVYGEKNPSSLRVDFPQTHRYSKIIKEAESGRYVTASATSQDYLELTLPFLALLNETLVSRLSAALPDLEKARRINADGALAVYFLGLLFERIPRPESAATEYRQALEIAPDCYVAALGLARLMSQQGKQREALDELTQLEKQHPGNAGVRRQLAAIYTKEKEFERAGELITQALASDGRDADMLLLHARYLIEKGQAMQAQFPLDTYIQDNKESTEYLLLRARVAAEGFNNRTAALTTLRPLLRSNSNNTELHIYTIKLLLESSSESDSREGAAMLAAMLQAWRTAGGTVPYDLLELAMQDAVRRASWDEAKKYRDQIPQELRGSSSLLNSYEIEHGLGNNREALSYARELREKYPGNEDGNIAYVTALMEAGQKKEAARVIEERLSQLKAGSFKSRYYYLRSRLQTTQDAVQSDLRAALFENPRNMEAILAMFEIYDKRGDERRAVYYLKQALALSPNNAVVKSYEKKYAGKL